MTDPVVNERAWAINVVSEIILWANTRKCRIRSAGGEWGVSNSTAKTTFFPDVLLFGDPSQHAVLQGWELKTPDTPVTDEAFVKNAETKAKLLGLGSFLLWNGTEAVLYAETGAGYNCCKSWTNRSIATRSDLVDRKDEWLRLLHDILNDLDVWFERAEIPVRNPIDKQTAVILNALVAGTQAPVSDAIQIAAAASGEFRAQVDDWWKEVSREHPKEAKKWSVLATSILLHWAHRFLFAHYLKPFLKDARQIDQFIPDEMHSVEDAETFFDYLSSSHDYVQLFKPFFASSRIPASVWAEMLHFNSFLRSVRVDALDPHLLQSMIYSIKHVSERKALGQYCTPPILADLLVQLTIDDVRADVLDPCCGSGTIAKAALAFKMHYRMSMSDALATTWASDKQAIPLQFATLALASLDAHSSTLLIFQHDVLDLHVGDDIPFVDASTGATIHKRLPSFPCLVLNPPFVRFESWRKNNPLADNVADDIRALLGFALDKKSDLFAHLVLRLWHLASDENGRIGVVVSNAWLGADWGGVFRRALLNLFELESVVTSAEGRWFQDAKVVTNILILKKRRTPSPPAAGEVVSFAATTHPISQWNSEVVADIAATLRHTHSTPSAYVNVVRKTVDDIVKADSMGLCWSAHFGNLSWLDAVSASLVPAADLFQINRGERRGWERLFFPSDDIEIESEYLCPALKTTASAKRYIAEPTGRAFCCGASLGELESRGHLNALRWIRRFEHLKNEKGEPLQKSLARAGLHWYEMNPDTLADIALSVNYATRLFALRLKQRAFVKQRLIRFIARQESSVDLTLCHALLCSVMGCFYLEALGFGRGLGALDLNAKKVSRQLRMLNPSLVSPEKRGAIERAFNPILKRDILPFLEEVKRPDRLCFEKTVLDAFGLSDLLPAIINSVVSIHQLRIRAVK